MQIGILQSAGIAGKIIEHALNHPEHTDVFTPIIYSKENQNERNVSSDLKFGNISAVVVAPGSATELKFNGSMTVFVDEHIRVAAVMEEETEELTGEFLAERARKAWNCVKRDFYCSLPRIALLSSGNEQTDKELLAPVVAELNSNGVYVYGPYATEQFLSEGNHIHFDLTLAITKEQAQKVLTEVAEETYAKLQTALPIVVVQTGYSVTYDFDEGDLEKPAQALRNAVYTAMEVCRNREDYDQAHHDPLQKLYHERRDDSEKVRFSIPRPKTPSESEQ